MYDTAIKRVFGADLGITCTIWLFLSLFCLLILSRIIFPDLVWEYVGTCFGILILINVVRYFNYARAFARLKGEPIQIITDIYNDGKIRYSILYMSKQYNNLYNYKDYAEFIDAAGTNTSNQIYFETRADALAAYMKWKQIKDAHTIAKTKIDPIDLLEIEQIEQDTVMGVRIGCKC
jgi:hypothetical protein